MAKRNRAKHALGQPICFVGEGATTSTITTVGVLATDIVVGVIDITTAGTAQATLANVTPSADLLTVSGATPWTIGSHYAVVVWRPAT